MSEEHLHLTQVLKMDSWQNLQDALAAVTKLAIVTVDYKGAPVTSHSRCVSYCRALRSDARYGEYCKRCDAIGGLEAVQAGKPHIYLCHRGIVDISIPILVNDQYLGAVMAGQVRISDAEKRATQIDHISFPSEICAGLSPSPRLTEQYNQIPILTYHEIETITNLLFHMCNYLVEIAVDKQILLGLLHHFPAEPETNLAASSVPSYNIETLRKAKEELSGAITESYLKYDADVEQLQMNSVIKPAVSYILQHKNEKVTAEQMARICHVSTGYFSRIFKQEIGEGFSAYLSHLKVEWAKHLLAQSDIPVNKIGDMLGFSDTGYFIKVFKKNEHFTPSFYRKYHRQ